MTHASKYFYGNEVSAYGQANKRVDYRTLAKAFDAVLNNDIMAKTWGITDWEQISGFVDNSEEIEELNELIEGTENSLETDEFTEDEREAMQYTLEQLKEELEELEEEQDRETDVFQWYIVSDNAVEILEEAHEIVYYSRDLDMYLWGVTHYGTSWDYVLTDIVLDI